MTDIKPAPYKTLREAQGGKFKFRLIQVWHGHYYVQAFNDEYARPGEWGYRSHKNATKKYEKLVHTYGAAEI